MSDLTTYRTAEIPYPDRVHVGHGFSGWVDPPTVVASLVDGGVLVPDHRLQAIADAYDNYLTAEQVGTPIQVDSCRGHLFRLLDALTEENKT